MNQLILCFISFFSVVGVCLLIKSIVLGILNSHKENPFIVIGVKNHADSIEGIVRTLIKQHPKSEILIIDYGSLDETPKIIEKLSFDYPFIHSKTKRL